MLKLTTKENQILSPLPIYLNSKAIDQTSSDASSPSANLKPDISIKIAELPAKPASGLPDNATLQD